MYIQCDHFLREEKPEYSDLTSGKSSEWLLSHPGFISPPSHLLHPTWVVFSTVSPNSRGVKPADDLMQDEKRQPFLSFFLNNTTWVPFPLHINNTPKHSGMQQKADVFLLRLIQLVTCPLPTHPPSSPEAKHDYPILMRFLI